MVDVMNGEMLEIVKLGSEFTIELPHGWAHGDDGSGAWLCESPGRDCSLYLQIEALKPGKGGLLGYVDDVLDFFKGLELTREIRIFPVPSGEIVRAIVDHDEKGRLMRTIHWCLFLEAEGDVVLTRWTFGLEAARADEPRMRELFDLFDAQVMRAELGVGPAPSNAPASSSESAASRAGPPSVDRGRPVGPEGGKYGFHRLKEIECFDSIALRVPERWQCGGNENGLWGSYEEGEETGTLWVGYDLYATTADADEAVIQFRDMLLEELAERFSELSPEIRDHVLYFEDDAPEDGEMLRHHRWHLVRGGGKILVLVQVSLVLPHSLLGDDEFHDLVRLMDREVRDLRLSGLPKG